VAGIDVVPDIPIAGAAARSKLSNGTIDRAAPSDRPIPSAALLAGLWGALPAALLASASLCVLALPAALLPTAALRVLALRAPLLAAAALCVLALPAALLTALAGLALPALLALLALLALPALLILSAALVRIATLLAVLVAARAAG